MSVDFSDSCVARHHNGLCVVCISPRHPIVAQGLRVEAVEYRAELRAVRGKRKRGGLFVEERTGLCSLQCEGGLQFNVQCSVRGILVEYNDALQENPSLVAEQPLECGYLAIILPPTGELATATDALCDAAEYDASVVFAKAERKLESGKTEIRTVTAKTEEGLVPAKTEPGLASVLNEQ